MNKEPSIASKEVPEEGLAPAQVRSWVARAQAGDQDAFGQLVQAYHERVVSLAYRIVNNPEDARDLAQQSWIKAWQKLDTFKGNSAFYTWMYRLVTFVCLDYLRKRKRMAEVSMPDGFEPVPEVGADPAPSARSRPDREVQNAETRDVFMNALEILSPEHRTALILREVEGLSYEEIAAAMKCRKGTVMSRLYYARKQLQVRMKELR